MHCSAQADCAAEQQQHIEETGGKVEQLSLEQAPSKGNASCCLPEFGSGLD